MILKIKVKPESGKQEIKKTEEGYIISLKEKAKNNKANIEMLKLLKDYFKSDFKEVKIIKGLRNRNKIVEIK